VPLAGYLAHSAHRHGKRSAPRPHELHGRRCHGQPPLARGARVAATKLILQNFAQLSSSASFLRLPSCILSAVMMDDALHAPEHVVFEALIRWIADQAPPPSESVESELLSHVRFPHIRAEALKTIEAHPLVLKHASLPLRALREALSKEDTPRTRQRCVPWGFSNERKGSGVEVSADGLTVSRVGETSDNGTCSGVLGSEKFTSGSHRWRILVESLGDDSWFAAGVATEDIDPNESFSGARRSGKSWAIFAGSPRRLRTSGTIYDTSPAEGDLPKLESDDVLEFDLDMGKGVLSLAVHRGSSVFTSTLCKTLAGVHLCPFLQVYGQGVVARLMLRSEP